MMDLIGHKFLEFTASARLRTRVKGKATSHGNANYESKVVGKSCLSAFSFVDR